MWPRGPPVSSAPGRKTTEGADSPGPRKGPPRAGPDQRSLPPGSQQRVSSPTVLPLTLLIPDYSASPGISPLCRWENPGLETCDLHPGHRPSCQFLKGHSRAQISNQEYSLVLGAQTYILSSDHHSINQRSSPHARPPFRAQTSLRGSDPHAHAQKSIPGSRPQTQYPVLYRDPDLHGSPDHPSMTQSPDLPPGTRPPSGVLTSILGPMPPPQDPDPIPGSDLQGRAPIITAGLGSPSRALTSIQGRDLIPGT